MALSNEYLTVTQAAKELKKTTGWIRNLCIKGILEGAEKLDVSNWLIPRESVLNYKPMKRGVKPGTQGKKAKLAAEKAAFLDAAKGAEDTKANDHG
jgi:hypothetical protein